MSAPEYLLAGALGISLAAAVGFRVFVPLLIVAITARAGWLQPPVSFQWVAGNAALVTFAIAAAAEVAAYYLPGVDNLLDALTAPLALVAGTLLVAAPLWDLPPLLKWTTAVIAGGGAAGATQVLTSLLRAKSTLATGGIANPVVSTGELVGSVLLSVLALALPLLAISLLLVLFVFLVRRMRRLARRTV